MTSVDQYYRVMRHVIFITILALALIPTTVLSQKVKVSKQFPVYDNGGKPDLVVDPSRFVSSMQIVDRNFSEGNCAIPRNKTRKLSEPVAVGIICAV